MRVRGHLDLLRRMDANNSKRNLPHKRFGKPRNKFYTHKCLAIHYANSLHNCRTLQWAQHSSISDTATHSLLVWQTWHINALVSTALQIFNNLNCTWGWKVRVRVCETCTCDICIWSAVCEAQHDASVHDCDDGRSSACYCSAENLFIEFWVSNGLQNIFVTMNTFSFQLRYGKHQHENSTIWS